MVIKDFSELHKEWLKKEKQMRLKNVSEKTFNFVRDNPGVTYADIKKYIASIGLNPGSAIAFIGKSIKASQMMKVDGHYYTSIPEYKYPKQPAKIKKVVQEVKPVEPVNRAPKLSAEYIVSHIPVNEAKSLYLELKEIFENV
jgi:hypothetical protein